MAGRKADPGDLKPPGKEPVWAVVRSVQQGRKLTFLVSESKALALGSWPLGLLGGWGQHTGQPQGRAAKVHQRVDPIPRDAVQGGAGWWLRPDSCPLPAPPVLT